MATVGRKTPDLRLETSFHAVHIMNMHIWVDMVEDAISSESLDTAYIDRPFFSPSAKMVESRGRYYLYTYAIPTLLPNSFNLPTDYSPPHIPPLPPPTSLTDTGTSTSYTALYSLQGVVPQFFQTRGEGGWIRTSSMEMLVVVDGPVCVIRPAH